MTESADPAAAGFPVIPAGTDPPADAGGDAAAGISASEAAPGVDPAVAAEAAPGGDVDGAAAAPGDAADADPPPPADRPDSSAGDLQFDQLLGGEAPNPALAAKMSSIAEDYDDQGRPSEAPSVGSERLAVRDRPATAPTPAAAAAAAALPRLDPAKVEARTAADPDAYIAASLSHAFGLLGPDDPPQVDLDRQLFAELADLGLDLDAFKADLAALAKGDQRAFRLSSFQTALRTTFEQQRVLLAESVSKLKHSFDTTDRVRLNLLRQAQAVFLLFDAVEQRLKDDINRLGGQATALDASYSALVRKFERLDLLVYDVEERSGAMKEEVRRAGVEIRGSGPAVQRLALIGSAAGGLAGGFVAFLLLMSLWLVFA